MLDLIQNYSISEILSFLVILALGIKGVITFYDWAKERIRKVFDKEVKEEQNDNQVKNQITSCEMSHEALKNSQAKLQEALNDLSKKVNTLIESDRDDIKSFITREHHYFCYQKKWIDDYSLDCIEKRYKHYVEEGGNSFIKDLMEEIEDLPKQPPQ